MAYISTQDFCERYGIQSNRDEATITQCIEAATAWIDRKCNRTFGLTDVEERTFKADGVVVITDDVAEFVSADAELDAGYHSTGRPITHFFTDHVGPVKITGRFGWSEVPPEVIEATFLLANRLLKRRETASGTIGFSEIGAVIRLPWNDPDATLLLAPYTKRAIA